jgi:cytoplasmic iron level regulating protein YaaA (DUF328/UPF0246 family)
MKILLAPSKTMADAPAEAKTDPDFPAKTNALLNRLRKYSVSELKSLFDVSDAIAQENYDRFQAFNPVHKAMDAYTGYMFKMMDKPSLSNEALAYIERHLLIVSGLYGLVKMTDKIGHYRLPMGVKVEGEALDQYWEDTLTEALKGEFVIDLLSQEYRNAFHMNDLDSVTIDFVEIKDGREKRPAMMLKKCRGLMVRACAQGFVTDRDSLKKLNIDGFIYNDEKSSDAYFVFERHA